MVATDPIELDELQRTTQDLIDHDQVTITLVRDGFERTPSLGVRRTGPTAQDPLTVFFGKAIGRNGVPRIIETNQGEQHFSEHVLIGGPTFDVQENDTFALDDREYTVAAIDEDRSYQTKAWCIERA